MRILKFILISNDLTTHLNNHNHDYIDYFQQKNMVSSYITKSRISENLIFESNASRFKTLHLMGIKLEKM